MKRYYEDPKDNAAFERCIDIMARLFLKYGKQVLEKQEQRRQVELLAEEQETELQEADTDYLDMAA